MMKTGYKPMNAAKGVINLLLLVMMQDWASAEGGIPKGMTSAEARGRFNQAPTTDTHTPYHPTEHPGAQWFPKAGFGLFIHWGMYSHAEVRPSWGILHNRFKQKFPRDIEVEEYYGLAEKFNPQSYDPEKWMQMAKALGMQYVVITTKHHDGYCLWPSEYGDYNTKTGAGGRDLIGEYVAAARRHGLKVGFYFSPRDWGYNNHRGAFPVIMQKFDRENPVEFPFPVEQNNAEYLKWIDYTVGQLSELLTQYGPIDVLWFDGANWAGDVPNNEYGNKVRNWIYSIQPQIVINPRWGNITNPNYAANMPGENERIARSAGDFYTFEAQWKHIVDPSHNAGVFEPIWFEFCDIWKGWSWGYEKAASAQADPKSMHRILERLSTLRAFGGNYLLNIGPDGNGQLRPDIKAEAGILSDWIELRKAAFFGMQPVKQWEELSPAPLTRSGHTLYVHLTGEKLASINELVVSVQQEPITVMLLGKPVRIDCSTDAAGLHLSLPVDGRDPLGEIVAIQFSSLPSDDVLIQ